MVLAQKLGHNLLHKGGKKGGGKKEEREERGARTEKLL